MSDLGLSESIDLSLKREYSTFPFVHLIVMPGGKNVNMIIPVLPIGLKILNGSIEPMYAMKMQNANHSIKFIPAPKTFAKRYC